MFKFICLGLGGICLVALLIIYFQNYGVTINTTMTGLFFGVTAYTEDLMVPCILFGTGMGAFLSLGIAGFFTSSTNDDE